MSAPTLSDRELDVLELTAAGLNPMAIAAELGIHHDTVRKTATKLYRRLGALSSEHAVALGYVRGLLGGRR